MNEDRYPTDSDRRRFVKGVVGGAALSGIGASAAAAANALSSRGGVGGGTVEFYGVENVAGPAPRAMPQVPVRVDEEGYLGGVWPEVTTETEDGREVTVAKTEDFGGSGVTYRGEWFQYCGVQTYPGVDPEADQDDYFRYSWGETGPKYDWLADDVSSGDRLHVDDFRDYESWDNGIGEDGLGKPATATWRSEGVRESNTMPVEVVRSPVIEEMAARAPDDSWIAASTDRGFLAHLNKCTHFCCTPGFKTSTYEGAEDRIYCQCHQSIYDPFSIVEEQFVALPRPD